MNFPFPFYSPVNEIGNTVFPFYCLSEQQIQPATVLISNPLSFVEKQAQPEEIANFIPTQTSIHQRSVSPPPSSLPRRDNRPIKKPQPQKKDENFGFRNQNKDRNMISGLLKGYVQFILHNRGMVKMIENLSKRRGLENGVSSFYDFMSRTFPSKKSYIGIQYMQTALGRHSQHDDMNYILGVTLKLYLRDTYLLGLLQGSKLKKKMRLVLLKKVRAIASQLFED